MKDDYNEHDPELQEFFREHGYSRPTLFDRIDPATTAEQAEAVADKIRTEMAKTGIRNVVGATVIGERFHVSVLVDQFLGQKDAPPEYVDGVYVSISRVNSLDYFFQPPAAPKPPGP